MHKLDSPYLRWTLGPLGLVASVIILAVSGSMNYRFGYNLGRSPLDALIYGWASAGADILKAIAPFFFFAAVASRQKGVALAAGMVWVIMTAYGLTSAAGHAALNRLDTTSHRTVVADAYKDLRADKARFAKELETWTAAVNRPSDAIKAEIDGAKFGKMWTTTSGCKSEVVTPDRRGFCQNIQKLEADLGTAMKREEYARKLEEVSAKLAKAGEAEGGVALSESDPQASILARLSRQDVPTVQMGLALLIVLMLEVGGGLGPYASIRYMTGGARVLDLKPEASPSTASAAASALMSVAAPIALTPPGLSSGSLVGAALPTQPLPSTDPVELEPENAPRPVSVGSQEAVPADADNRPVNPFLGRPTPGSESELRSFGFPVDGRPPGPSRPKLAVKDEALQFCTALRAYGMANIAIPQTDVPRLYRQYAIANHREMVEEAALLEVMQRMRSAAVRVEYGKMRYDDNKPENKRLSYKIAGKTFPKPQQAPPPGGGAERKNPFTPSPAAANDAAPAPAKRHLAIVPMRSFQPDGERWSLHDQVAEARRLKAEQRGQSRQMRRTQHRWAA